MRSATKQQLCEQELQQPCVLSLQWTAILQYYEDIWDAVVLVAFTVLVFVFNGVVFAMCVRAVPSCDIVWLRLTRSRLTEERVMSQRQLMLVYLPFLRWLARPLLPKGWTSSSFKTSVKVDVHRVELRTLGTRLAVLSICRAHPLSHLTSHVIKLPPPYSWSLSCSWQPLLQYRLCPARWRGCSSTAAAAH